MKNIVNDIRKKQDELIVMINSTFDSVIKDVTRLNKNNNTEINEYELIYPITNATGFKGKKVIAVIINDKRFIAPTWKTVVSIVLGEVVKDSEKKKQLYNLRDKLLGRIRTRISSNSKSMRSPLKIEKNLYVETHYDTETLINLLIKIMNDISYDYSKIKIVIKS